MYFIHYTHYSWYSWCVVSALVPWSCGSPRIIQVDAAHWWWLRRDHPPTHPPHDCKALWGCTAIHNKALYKCIILIFQNSHFGAWNTEISENHDARIFVSIGTRPNSLIPPVTLCISPLLPLLNALSLSYRPGSLIEQHLLLPLWDY